MGKKEKVASVLQLVGGKSENVEKIVDELDSFFESLNFARFQMLLKK